MVNGGGKEHGGSKGNELYMCMYIQGVPGGMDKISGECSLC